MDPEDLCVSVDAWEWVDWFSSILINEKMIVRKGEYHRSKFKWHHTTGFWSFGNVKNKTESVNSESSSKGPYWCMLSASFDFWNPLAQRYSKWLAWTSSITDNSCATQITSISTFWQVQKACWIWLPLYPWTNGKRNNYIHVSSTLQLLAYLLKLQPEDFIGIFINKLMLVQLSPV